MKRKDKIVVFSAIFILVLLIIGMGQSILQNIDYNQRKDSGNERWLQVENRILQTEEKVNKLEEEIERWNK